jgi:uncharacterized protein (DUF983 family)
MSAEHERPPSVIVAGLLCRCPRCGRGRLFSGFLTVADTCETCGLDLTAHDSGDGPAVFVVLLVGALVVAFALVLEVTVSPPTWVHFAIEFPLIIAGSLGLLRPLKATLIALRHKHDAGERHDRV